MPGLGVRVCRMEFVFSFGFEFEPQSHIIQRASSGRGRARVEKIAAKGHRSGGHPASESFARELH